MERLAPDLNTPPNGGLEERQGREEIPAPYSFLCGVFSKLYIFAKFLDDILGLAHEIG
jgi:hypothetical protein